jgi:hypothetical protein
MSPGGGTYTGFVKVTVAVTYVSSPMSLAVSTEESRPPTCPTISAYRSLEIMVTASSTLAAVACVEDLSSPVTTEKYVIEPGPVVSVSFFLEGDVSASDLTESVKTKLVTSFAATLDMAPEQISAVEIADARRRLLAVKMSLDILAQDADSAKAIADNVKEADFRQNQTAPPFFCPTLLQYVGGHELGLTRCVGNSAV